MSNLKCPFCGEKLYRYYIDPKIPFYICDNQKCKIGKRGHIATMDLWQELIRTRKALEVGKSVLENISSFYKSLILANPVSDINWDVVAKNFAKHSDEALEQITALEQKDVK